MSLAALHAPSHREYSLLRLTAIIDRLLARATQTSARFTRWRLAIFVVGAVLSVMCFQQRWFQLGNATLVGFLALFLTVARYHTKLEDRMQRLRPPRLHPRALSRGEDDGSETHRDEGSTR